MFLEESIIVAPSLANAPTNAFPIPDEAPVIQTTLFSYELLIVQRYDFITFYKSAKLSKGIISVTFVYITLKFLLSMYILKNKSLPIKFINGFIFLYLLQACANHQIKVPPNIMQKDSLINVMVDIHLLESTIDLDLLPHAMEPTKADHYYDLFRKHHITRAQFDSSINFYTNQEGQLSSIYDKVIEILKSKQDSLRLHK